LEQLLAAQSINLTLSMKIRLALGIAKGMTYVHSCGFFHRDLTSKNVLIRKVSNNQFDAVVGDFGLAAKIPRSKSRLETVGSPYWMSPECLKGQWYDQTSDVFSFGIISCEIIARVEADPDILPRTHSFGLDYLQYVNLCPTNTPPAFLRLTFYCCIYDPRSRPTFSEISQKLELLLDKLDKPVEDSRNGKRSAAVSSNKRYSIDNYCVNWLNTSCGSPVYIGTEQTPTAHETNNLPSPQNIDKTQDNSHENVMNARQTNNLHHRRSLSENIIPFPPHTAPSDKARCHLINRRNSQLISSSKAIDEVLPLPTLSADNDIGPTNDGIFGNTTLRKVAETMFLKDPQYKPHMNKQSYGKSNPFTTLTQLKGVKKIIGTTPATYTTGVCDLFSSCFEIRVTKDSPIFSNQRNVSNSNQKQKQNQQAKSLPSSPKITQRKLSKIDKFVMQTSSKCNDNVNDLCDNENVLFNSDKAKISDNLKQKMELLDVPNQCQTIIKIANETNNRNDLTDSTSNSRTGTLKKKNASSLFSHPLFKCKEDCGRDDSHYYEHPKLLRGGSSESGFFSCLTDDDFSMHHRPLAKLSINGPCDYDPSFQYMDDRSSTIPSSLRSFDDFDLFDRNTKFDSSANDSLSVDMGLVNRLSLDSEINSLFHKNQLNNQLLYCKNRTSSIYTDSSEDISSLAGSDSLLWDDRMSTYSTTIPNQRSAQIAKIVEYFERNLKNSGTIYHQAKALPTQLAQATSTPIANDDDCLQRKVLTSQLPPTTISYQTTLSTTSKEYEAFCLDKNVSTPQRLNVCEGVVKSKLQLFDKLRNN